MKVVHALFTLAFTITLYTKASAQDWLGLGDPLHSSGAHPGPNRKWVTDWQLSDSFWYPNKSHPNFQKWTDYNPTGWTGPGATLFTSDNVYLAYGKLIIMASRIPPQEQGTPYCVPHAFQSSGCRCDHCFWTKRTTHTGYVSSRKLLHYPIYTECSMRGSATPLSSNFWLKSRQTEIDVNESYGDDDYRSLAKSNVHFFGRSGEPFHSSINGQQHISTNVDLTASFNRYGVHWVSRTLAEFYFNGRKVRSLDLTKSSITDPTGQYLNEGMRLIFDLEAHHWRKHEGVPSDEELYNPAINHMAVDWVRTYHSAPV